MTKRETETAGAIHEVERGKRTCPIRLASLMAITVTMTAPGPAWAYIGPGTSMGAVGVFVAVVGGVFLLLVGFLWYPIRRVIRGRRNAEDLAPKIEKK